MFKYLRIAPSLVLVAILTLIAASTAKADNFVFQFQGTAGGVGVDGTASFTGNAGSNILNLTLTNNLTSTTAAGHTISGISFEVWVNGAPVNVSPITISAQTGRLVEFSSGSTFNDLGGSNAPDDLHWGMFNDNQLTTLHGFAGPGQQVPGETIAGVPNVNNATNVEYTGAGASLTGSQHQPLIVNTASFSLTITGTLPQGFEIRNVTMYFGTDDSPLTAVPEPASMMLLGTGLVGVAAGLRRRFRK